MSGQGITHDRLFDAAAESLILLDPADGDTVAELVERLAAIAEWFGEDAGSDHPAHVCVAAAGRLATGETDALGDIERAFGAARSAAERHAASQAQAPARMPEPAPNVAADAAATAVSAAEPAPTEAAAMPLAGDEELLRDFAVRAAEHLDDADEHLLELESDPSSREAVDAVFRAFHTIKGMAGFLALDAIGVHAHGSESLLADARATGSAVSSETVQALFVAVDTMRILVAETTGVRSADITAADSESGAGAPRATASASGVRVERGDTAAGSSRAGTVRVEEARLDALLDAIGELVIAESMMSASVRNGDTAAMVQLQVERLDKITRELQQMATSLRMVSLRATFRRMERLVRDLAHKAGKQIEFVTSGEDTELDKTVVDRIGDPLIHALRNAVDHGIEPADERLAAGKPASGRVELRAYHAGGAINIDVEDDGRGIDTKRVVERGRAAGLLGEDEVSERTAFELLYQPGFSTAETVTDVSGRGVGMDVVRRTVEELRGRIELSSEHGSGTKVSVRLPVTLAIIDGMVARVGGERYVIPMLAIERSIRPAASELTPVTGKGLMLSTPEGHLPVIRLHKLFGIDGAEADPTEAVVIIVNDNGVRAGLLACELLGQQQTVIKPLGDGLPVMSGVSGGAIMPDGRVGLILDAAGLVRLAHEQGGE